MEIRKIEPRDFARVAQLENENWTAESTPIIMNSSAESIMDRVLKGMNYLLATENGKIVAILDYNQRHALVAERKVIAFGLMTIKNQRRKGIAQRLIQYFLELAKKEGYRKISIEVLSTNSPAIHFYEKLGFICEGRQKAEFYLNDHYVDNLFYAYFLEED